MIHSIRKAVKDQYAAALQTLTDVVTACPDTAWNEPVCNLKFNQAAFHALIYADLYLDPNPDVLKEQPFHHEHAEAFDVYEEFSDQAPIRTYERPFILAYLDHVRGKADAVATAITEQSLQLPSGFSWIEGNALEVHLYNIRHIQHHAAQLSLRLRLDHGTDIRWVRSGWRED